MLKVDYPGSDVIIHKKDFLIHIKKLSVRSQSSDCAEICRRDSNSPAVQRRSSSAVAQVNLYQVLLLFQISVKLVLCIYQWENGEYKSNDN